LLKFKVPDNVPFPQSPLGSALTNAEPFQTLKAEALSTKGLSPQYKFSTFKV